MVRHGRCPRLFGVGGAAHGVDSRPQTKTSLAGSLFSGRDYHGIPCVAIFARQTTGILGRCPENVSGRRLFVGIPKRSRPSVGHGHVGRPSPGSLGGSVRLWHRLLAATRHAAARNFGCQLFCVRPQEWVLPLFGQFTVSQHSATDLSSRNCRYLDHDRGGQTHGGRGPLGVDELLVDVFGAVGVFAGGCGSFLDPRNNQSQ